MGLKMLPRLSKLYVRYSMSIYSILFRYASISSRSFSNFLYFLSCKLSVEIFLPPSGSSFFRHVFTVIALCSQEKMIWVYTLTNVAFMKYTYVFRNFSAIKTPSGSMSRFLNSTKNKRSIVCIARRSPFPQPTSFCFTYFLFESLSNHLTLIQKQMEVV